MDNEVKIRQIALSDKQVKLLLKSLETAEKNAARSANNCDFGNGSAKSLEKKKNYLELKEDLQQLHAVIFKSVI